MESTFPRITCFNPRICKRCDFLIFMFSTVKLSFNPRICKRCDKTASSRDGLRKSFNPRICKRCDGSATCFNNPSFVSIHASVKDATNET